MSINNDANYTNMESGILNKEQIKHAFDNHELIDDYDPKGLQPCSYDLHVGTIYKKGKMIEDASLVDIEPGEIITIHTIESLKLPNDIAATVYPINEQSSEGFMVLNPGHVDPGYKGVLTVKAINLTKNRLSRMRGDKIFTIIFEKLSLKTDGYDNKSSNDEKKRKQLKIERDISPENICLIPSYWKNNKVFAYTESDVEKIVTSHAITIATLVIALLALLISVLFSGYAIWKDVKTPPPIKNESELIQKVETHSPSKFSSENINEDGNQSAEKALRTK